MVVVVPVVVEDVDDDLEVVVCEVVLVVEEAEFDPEPVVDEEEELIEVLDELEVLEALDEVEELVDDAALMASTITPKSLPWAVPNERRTPDIGAERTSY